LIVHQVLSGAGPVDAVTQQALAFRRLFGQWGWGGADVAERIDPRVGSAVRPLARLNAARGDTLLIHYSAYSPGLRPVMELPVRKVLLSHNVTPARWFWDFEPTIALHCALGRRQLPLVAEACDVVAGVSSFNAAELGSDRVVPILFDPPQETPQGSDPSGSPTLLFVGRLAPHKRQDELIRLVAMLRRERLPDVRLELVGEPLNPNYLAALEGLADEVAPGAVTFSSGLSAGELAARYRAASVVVSLSEHEGFWIPGLEAFHFGVPVVARPAGAVPGVAGDAALLVPDDDPAVVAELLHLAVSDAELRAELRRRAAARVAAYAPERTEAVLRELVGGLLSTSRA
jgi:L-malate glycosyltransferase